MVYGIEVETGKHRNLMMECQMHLPPLEPSEKDYDVAPDAKELCFVADSVTDFGTDQNHDLYTLALVENSPAKNITKDNPATDNSPDYSPNGHAIAFIRQTTKFFYADRARLMVYNRAISTSEELTPKFDRSVSN